MSDPLALLPLAAAAGGGRVDGFDAGQLVAAGLAVLRRSAPLVRALSGRRAAILLPTSHQFLTALAASDGRGAVLKNPLAAPPEIAYQLNDADVGAVFTSSALASRLPAHVPRVLHDDSPRAARVIIDGRVSDLDLGSHVGLPLEGDRSTDGRDEEATIVYTSAMAGRPLGAILTHRNLLANARSTGAATATTRDDRVLAVLPFAHLFGLTVTGIAPLLAGGDVRCVARFAPSAALERLERDEITMLVGVPAVFGALLSAIERRGAGVAAAALRLCLCGGAVLTDALQDRWATTTGIELRQGYGLTEAGPVCLFNHVDRANRRGVLGRPLAGVDVDIRDPATGRALPPGDAGEICVRGENVFRGYVSGSDDGLAVRDGWLHTGDRGIRHDDGSIAFLGLLKSMFTRSGFNIYPREIERVVGAMPGVRDARVHAIPDGERENDIAVQVVGAVTPDEVRAWCSSRLSAYKQPAAITITTP